MYIAIIGGWEETISVAQTEKKAKDICMAEWKRNCADDVASWSWEEIDVYCGAFVTEVKGNSFTIHEREVKLCPN